MRASRRPRMILLSILALAGTDRVPAAEEVVHPAALQKSDCAEAPGDAMLTGHALFSYRVETSGAVGGIKLLYADVQPADRREDYLAGVTSCLQKWRYRPATVKGAAVAATMTVAFHHFPPASGEEREVSLPDGRLVSVSLLKQVRTATLAFTDSLLRGRSYRESQGDGWSLRTDLPKSALDDVQGAIEFARRVFDEAFPGPGGQAGAPGVTVVLFKDENDYQHLSAFDNFIPNRARVAGQYDPDLRMIYSALGKSPMPIFARTVAHEATHHFAEQRLAGGDGRIPRWLGEGVAQFVECTRMAKPGQVRLEALDRGVAEQSAFVMVGAEAYTDSFLYRKRAERALSNLREHLDDVDLAALLDDRLDPRFYGEGGDTLYDVSWLLVHYLMNGDRLQHREAFRKWATDAGAPRNAESLVAAIGIPMKDLPGRLSAYLAQIK